jgi:hypothetical protein
VLQEQRGEVLEESERIDVWPCDPPRRSIPKRIAGESTPFGEGLSSVESGSTSKEGDISLA